MSNYQGPLSYDDEGAAGDDAPKSARSWLAAIAAAEKKLEGWQNKADRIDKLYANLSTYRAYNESALIGDKEFNLFWASMEVVKPSIYSRPPVPVVTPTFKDRNPVIRTASEMLERCAARGFSIADIDSVMLGVRDDLAIIARGVIWITYEDGKEAAPYPERVCIEHLDRRDFAHEPARKWADVGWVARRAWLTQKQAVKRFGEASRGANYGKHDDERGENDSGTPKAGFWEIWSKTDDRVYWVVEGVENILDSEAPFLKLRKFFPCPRPAYSTTERRSLVPVPDIVFIEDQLDSINTLTARIHDLCDELVVYGLIPAGSDVGDAIATLMRKREAGDPSTMFVPVPAAQFGSQSKFVEWMPIDMYANAILAAVQARRELIGNVQELFGIADIMRGETEAQETLGAQKLKAQFGSVRIRDRVQELVRIGRDTLEIVSEIQADQFDFDTLLDMSRMDIPTRADIKKKIADANNAARAELGKLANQAEQLMASPEVQQNPDAAKQQLQQAQQAIIGKYQPILDELVATVTQEDVKELLADQKTGFADFDIQTDSTIYPDEQAEKQSRNEFMQVFATVATALAPLVQTGEAGAELAGTLMKFQLGPYRAGREVDAAIDEWIDSIKNMPPQDNGKEQAALVEAQNKLAEAEIQKAKAATMSVEAKAASENQKLQAKMFELQQKAANDEQKAQLEIGTLQGKLAEQDAKINLMQAQTAEILNKIGLDVRKQDLEEYRAAVDTQMKANDQQRQDAQAAQQVEGQAFEQEQRVRAEDRQDRSQAFTEQQTQEGGNA